MLKVNQRKIHQNIYTQAKHIFIKSLIKSSIKDSTCSILLQVCQNSSLGSCQILHMEQSYKENKRHIINAAYRMYTVTTIYSGFVSDM